ncbi:MAG: hypothetical protein LBH97_02085 [Treponema sp.]|jgi:hypothetical protein|nr:hypothetical protein [Treponema sp.]
MNSLVPVLKDRAILLGWIFGLALAGALLWSLTQPLRAGYLLRAVNKTLVASGDTRRLLSPLPRPAAKTVPLATWYSLTDSNSRMCVFAIMRNGILIPCGAYISADGTVEDIIPIGGHAAQMFERIPQGIMQIYVRKIESLSAAGRGGR